MGWQLTPSQAGRLLGIRSARLRTTGSGRDPLWIWSVKKLKTRSSTSKTRNRQFSDPIVVPYHRLKARHLASLAYTVIILKRAINTAIISSGITCTYGNIHTHHHGHHRTTRFQKPPSPNTNDAPPLFRHRCASQRHLASWHRSSTMQQV